MRISEISDGVFTRLGSTGAGRDVRTLRVAIAADAQDVSLPTVTELREAGRARRDEFLAALRSSIASGGYTCEPEQLAEAILERGLEGL